jgi:nicotinamide-nucleotide amidase
LDLFRTTTVGDNAERIAQAVRSSMDRAQVILTTGGLGPTVDDATREGIALALDVELEFHPELWEQIQERFKRFGRKPTENNRRQAFLPKGARAIDNPIGTAPGFIVDRIDHVIAALQGVPAEMTYLLENEVIPFLRSRFDLQDIIKTRVLRTAGSGESSLSARLTDLEHLHNPTVGFSAHPGRVDIRITAKASTDQEASSMIEATEVEIRQRLGIAIYGIDDDELEQIVYDSVATRNWKMVVVEYGTGGTLTGGLAQLGEAFAGGEILPPSERDLDMVSAVRKTKLDHAVDVGLGLALRGGEKQSEIELVLEAPDVQEHLIRSYGGPPAYAVAWAVSAALDLLRRRLTMD